MRTGALVLGIIAGLAGLVSAVLALFVGGLGGAFDAEGAGTVVGLGWSALGFFTIRVGRCSLVLSQARYRGSDHADSWRSGSDLDLPVRGDSNPSVPHRRAVSLPRQENKARGDHRAD